MVIRTLAIVVLAMSALGCSDAPLAVQTIQVGRALNPDGSISSITTLFKPSETVYVAVLTTAAGSGTIGVRWLFGTQVIDEPVKKVSFKGPEATEFHLQNSGGFPPGDYSVEVVVDGKPAGSRNFKVGER